jgi:hypothetical protein
VRRRRRRRRNTPKKKKENKHAWETDAYDECVCVLNIVIPYCSDPFQKRWKQI